MVLQIDTSLGRLPAQRGQRASRLRITEPGAWLGPFPGSNPAGMLQFVTHTSAPAGRKKADPDEISSSQAVPVEAKHSAARTTAARWAHPRGIGQ